MDATVNKPPRKLTNRQRRFVEYYLESWDIRKAATQAGYYNPELGYRQLKNPLIKELIEKRMTEIAMPANEVIARLGQQGRTNISMFLTFTEYVDGQTGENCTRVDINWEMVQKYGYLIKSIKPGRYGWELELHDSQNALDKIGKHLQLFSDRLDITTGGKVIEVLLKGKDDA